MANKTLEILCWNVNGIRAAQKKGFVDFVQKKSPDILCIQETKANASQLDEPLKNIPGYESHFHSAARKGYSGVAMYLKVKPLAINMGFGKTKFDDEGRVMSAEFPEFILYNIYFPNGGRGADRLNFKLDFYDAILEHWEKQRAQGKKLIICGDVNTAHKPIDVAKPEAWADDSGFLEEEREWIDKIVELGYVDTFRMFNDKPEQYTFWDPISRARIRNEGWRIDYFFVSKDLVPNVKNASILAEVEGSDHCPVGLTLAL